MAFNIWPWIKSRQPETTGILTQQNQPVTPQYNGTADRKHWDKIKFAFTSGNRNYFCFGHDKSNSIQFRNFYHSFKERDKKIVL